MREPTDDDVDYLLSRGRLGGEKRQQILESALAASGARPAPGRWRRWLWGGGTGLVLATGAAGILLWPRAEPRGPGFRAKGARWDQPASITMACLNATVTACPRGSLVAFSVDGGAGAESGAGAFVSAYAEPVSGGERIWYLTNEPVVAGVVEKAARIGGEHALGPYRVNARLTTRPLPREPLVSAADSAVAARAQFDLEVVP